MHNDDYNVGYGKPPKASQFKKGQSGNPKGRPKKVKEITSMIQAFEEVFMTIEPTMINGKIHNISGIKLFFMKMKEAAIKSNDHKERKNFIDFISKNKLIDMFEE